MTKTVTLYCVFHIEEDGNEPVLLHAFDNQDALPRFTFTRLTQPLALPEGDGSGGSA